MVKRIAAGSLWFVAVIWAFNYLSWYFGLPSLAGPVIAAAVAVVVAADPASGLRRGRLGPVRSELPVQAMESTIAVSAR